MKLKFIFRLDNLANYGNCTKEEGEKKRKWRDMVYKKSEQEKNMKWVRKGNDEVGSKLLKKLIRYRNAATLEIFLPIS